MHIEDLSAIYFQACQTLHGRRERVGVVKRNGHRALLLTPDLLDPERRESQSSPWLDNPKYYVNLNLIEQQTWRKILTGQSISSIAAEEGVSRQAVYGRIAGNSKGQGGMVAKNFWCLLWWRLRLREISHRPPDTYRVKSSQNPANDSFSKP